MENRFFLGFFLSLVIILNVLELNATVSQQKIDDRVCGKPSQATGFIVRGKSFNRGEFPWMVALLIKLKTPAEYFCAATLISTRHVITAAHCIKPKHGTPFKKLHARDLIALFGAYNLKDSYEIGRTALSPQKVQVHDDWNPDLESHDADIAILTFQAGAITLSSYVQPICLWNGDTLPSQTEGHIGGWGQSENFENFYEDIPTKLKVPIHTNEYCFSVTKDLVDLGSNRTFCAGKGDGSGICTGDGGGGLSIKDGSHFYFRGIVSSGLFDEIGCDVSKFSIFTDVLQFKTWIDQIMTKDGEILIQKVVQA